MNLLIRRSNKSRPSPILLSAAVSLLSCALCVSPAYANPTQEQVFKSIQTSVDSSVDGRVLFGILAGIAATMVLLVLANKYMQREVSIKPVNHQGKLMKELVRTAGLKPVQARQLRALAEELSQEGRQVEHPLTLLLCPSVLKDRE